MTEFNGKIGHLEDIESPWSNAGGVVKTYDDTLAIAKTGVGYIKAGSYTIDRRTYDRLIPDIGDQAIKAYYHDPETGLTYNGVQMTNEGIDVVEKQIPEMLKIAHSHKKALIVNVASVGDDYIKQAVELSRRAYAAGADAVLVNAGCNHTTNEEGVQQESY